MVSAARWWVVLIRSMNPVGRVAELHARIIVELQVVVCIDEPGQHAIAAQVDNHIVALGRQAHADHALTADPQAGAAESRHVAIHEADRVRGIHLCARTMNTSGTPCQRR